MKKNMIALAVAAAMVPGFAAAESKVSGFADIYYTNTDNGTKDKTDDLSVFTANAEVDFESKLSDIVSVRVDTDFALATNGGSNAGLGGNGGGPADSAAIEQAFFAASVAEGVTVIGGVFNNPIGWQAEDVVDWYTVTSTKVYGVLDDQTALYGNNIAGVAVAGDLGPVTVTGAVLNDIGLEAFDKQSIALVVNATPMAGLDVELGYVTQEDKDGVNNDADEIGGAGFTGGVGNVTNFNATYKNAGLTLGFEYMTAEKALDTGLTVMGNYMFTPAVGATIQYSSLDGDGFGGDADTRLSVAGIWNIADNLSVLAEYSTDENHDSDADATNGVDDEGSKDAITLEFIAKF